MKKTVKKAKKTLQYLVVSKREYGYSDSYVFYSQKELDDFHVQPTDTIYDISGLKPVKFKVVLEAA